MQSGSPTKLLILGAHPDDAEFHAGGLATRYRRRDRIVKMISVTNGGAGHHFRDSESLAKVRRVEAANSGNVIGAEYLTWDFPDGRLMPTLEVREKIIREIRTFQPDLVLTHRTCDYHPDHRAVGQAVQDASYMVTVPLVCSETPILRRDPVVAYMCDLFTKPCPLDPAAVLDVANEMDEIVQMLAEHKSQVFEFLPFNQGISDQVPASEDDQKVWLAKWFQDLIAPRAPRFRPMLANRLGDSRAESAQWVEAYEISEYAAAAGKDRLDSLFCLDGDND
jgi:LmbE family N-acetylglucosaminyl deacetylase